MGLVSTWKVGTTTLGTTYLSWGTNHYDEDFALINLPSQSNSNLEDDIYFTSSQSMDITGTTAVVNGTPVCVSRGRTGSTLCTSVSNSSVNMQFSYGSFGSLWRDDLIEISGCAKGGDSGSPVFSTSTGSTGTVAGMVISSTLTASGECPVILPKMWAEKIGSITTVTSTSVITSGT